MERAGITYEEAQEIYSASIPPPSHIGEPKDITYGVLFLASNELKFITG